MSEIVEIIETLESKIQKLFLKINELEQKNQALLQELKVSATEFQNQNTAGCHASPRRPDGVRDQ